MGLQGLFPLRTEQPTNDNTPLKQLFYHTLYTCKRERQREDKRQRRKREADSQRRRRETNRRRAEESGGEAADRERTARGRERYSAINM